NKQGSGSGNDGSGNKQGSGSGNDGSGNKQGSGLDSSGRGGQITAPFTYDRSIFGMFDSVGTVFSTTKIYFEYNKATLQAESAPMLDEIADALRRTPKIRIEIRGNTDNKGGADFNQRLSELRAEAVAQALVQRGIAEKRLQTRGFGLTKPITDNSTEENRQKNRRTEFAILAR
ncbi:MAG: OmpA family protein, partial [Candidatus Kapaibacterium sp.]